MTAPPPHDAPRRPFRQRLAGLGRISPATALTFVRYAIVGVLQNGLFYLVQLGLIQLGLTAWQGVAVLYPTATGLSYLLHRRFSFGRGNRGSSRRYVVSYVLAYLVAIALTAVQEWAGVAPWLASLITMASVAVGLFLVLNLWVFARET